MSYFNPYGKKIHLLEKTTLKYRAFEMMLIIFHIEQLKKLVRTAIESKHSHIYDHIPIAPRTLPKGTNNLFKKIWKILVLENILTQEESKEVQDLIKYRNKIAHSIQDLTFDASTQNIHMMHLEHSEISYKSGLLERISYFSDKIYAGLSGKYILEIGFDSLLFDPAQKVYEEELARLEKKILKLKKQRKEEIEKLSTEFDGIDKAILSKLQPNHPQNFLKNSKLSDKGVICCYKLFDLGISDIMISYLMKIPLSSVVWHRKKSSNDRSEINHIA